MIGLSRLKRAIEDVPTGGMQTGDQKVRLKLCDAQRLEVEFNAIIAERDSALSQNAELVAMVEALRIAALNAIQRMPGGEAKADLRDAYDATPTQHLRDHDAEAGRAGYELGAMQWSFNPNEMALDIERAADQYAEKVRRGEV